MANKLIKYGLAFDVVIVIIALLVIWRGIVNPTPPILAAFFPLLIGILMIASSILREISFLSKGLRWVAENISKPKTKYNHLIWGFFFIAMSFLTAYSRSRSVPQSEFFEQLEKEYSYWLTIIIVLLFNLAVGLYTARISKKRKLKKNIGT